MTEEKITINISRKKCIKEKGNKNKKERNVGINKRIKRRNTLCSTTPQDAPSNKARLEAKQSKARRINRRRGRDSR